MIHVRVDRVIDDFRCTNRIDVKIDKMLDEYRCEDCFAIGKCFCEMTKGSPEYYDSCDDLFDMFIKDALGIKDGINSTLTYNICFRIAK